MKDLGQTDYKELYQALNANTCALTENSRLLKKLHRNASIGMWFRFFSFLLLLSVPVALYYYVIEPFLTSLGAGGGAILPEIEQSLGSGKLSELLQNIIN